MARGTWPWNIFRPAAPRWLRFALSAAALFPFAIAGALTIGWAQHNASDDASNGNVTTHGLGSPRDPDTPAVSPQLQEQMAERRNSDRQKQLVADTEKLFQLAQQLRDEVGKSNKDQLSIPVVKKSEEIEKLARSVKEKMRGY